MPEITIQMDDSADTGNQAHEIQAAPGPPSGSVAVETLADNVVPIERSRTFAAGKPHVRLVELADGHELIASLPTLLAESEAFLAEHAS